mmetsp:Transcript_1764/g.3090  ORF Transcript_1764/g.3090 Transcript_1764/m.3090 type:complete len:90 (-) Transcript_1764:127-396(-)
MQRLLVHMQTLVPGFGIIGAGGVSGLSCSQLQALNVCGQLRGLEFDPWFVAVLANGLLLPGPLATLLVPCPGLSTGVCDPLSLHCTLWA